MIINYKNLKVSDFESIPAGDKILARPVELDNRKETKTFIFKDESGSFSCLLQTTEKERKLPEIKGLNIVYQYFGEPGNEKTLYILLECSMSAYLPNFTEILKEILTDFDNGTSDIGQSVIKVISKWRYFFSEPKSEIMSEENIVGLIGELMLLLKLLPLYRSESVVIWTADRGEEDFMNGDNVVEVKTTLKEKHEHIINGIDQLRIIPGRSKLILSLLFVKSDSENAVTLPSLINAAAELLSEYPEAYELFFKKLKSRGYDTRDADQYMAYRFSLINGKLFYVDGLFPKLTTDELNSPLSPRISKLRYTLDLEGLDGADFKDLEIAKII